MGFVKTVHSTLHAGEFSDSQPRGFNAGEAASDVWHTGKCSDCITGRTRREEEKNVRRMIPQSYALQLLIMPTELALPANADR